MGSGIYSFERASERSFSYRTKSREEIFTNRHIDPLMVIKDKIRESCDSDEHPKSYPIIIGLDVTGSMGRVPENLIKEAFPEIMKSIMDKGVEHAQICFLGIGDHYCDDAPIQVGQFETSDELTEKWLKAIYIEGGGGSNDGESYQLAYYFAAFHTKTDSFEKRGIKGTLVTIGDEPCLKSISKEAIGNLFGGGQSEMTTTQLIKAAQEKWDIYHINVKDYASDRMNSPSKWEALLGDHVILSQTMESKEIGDILSTVIVSSYKKAIGAPMANGGIKHQL